MAEEFINTAYIRKYLERAESATSDEQRKDALYRVGTHLEVIPCTGNTDLSPLQQQRVIEAATQALGGLTYGSRN
jgi:hypothetical protein